MKIRIAEIFESVSGEVGDIPQGSPTTFIRLAGCSLGCPFCDTELWQGKDSGVEEDINQVVAIVVGVLQWKKVIITGGEPLEQKDAVFELMRRLHESKPDYFIQVETNGSIRIPTPWRADCWVVDCKGRDAIGEVEYVFSPGVLLNNMWVKYIVGSSSDLEDAVRMAGLLLTSRPAGSIGVPKFAISPLVNKVSHQEVQEAILKSKLPIILNVQLHKKIGAR